MVRKQLGDYLDERAHETRNFSNAWNKFKDKKTYLVHDEKESFLSRLNNLGKIPWHMRVVAFFKGIKILDKRKIQKLKKSILSYNEEFVENRLETHESFFDGHDDGLKYPLDENQRRAIVKDDRHNLIVAGAGSGKTSVLTTKIAYLIRREDAIAPDRILALAFTRTAAEEMQTRLQRDFGIDVEISTFHSLGRKILNAERSRKPRILFDGSSQKKNELIEHLFKDVTSEPRFQAHLLTYLAYYNTQEPDEDSFEDKILYYKYMRNKKYTTLNRKKVKSISEKNIGNFLFMHGIKFEYEKVATWVSREPRREGEKHGREGADESSKDGSAGDPGKQEMQEDLDDPDERVYRPDFYLPEYDVYIEHWGMNHKLEVPSWFTISSEEYRNQREWKLDQFKKSKKTLIETWEHERLDGVLIGKLAMKLKKTIPGLTLKKKMSAQELIEKTHELKKGKNEISRLVGNFIQNAKSNFLTVADIEKRVNSKEFSKKQQVFGKIALEVYRRYQNYLEKTGEIDFDDMINNAVELVQEHPNTYRDMYDYILVDEFQDISYQRMQLINLFVNKHTRTKLFCVGDDWQSIYQFTGSNVKYFVEFHRYFPHPNVSYLKNNYRSSRRIVEMSNELIAHNSFQKKKEITSNNAMGTTPIYLQFRRGSTHRFKNRIPYYHKLIKLLLDNHAKPHEITVLSRFNNNLKDLEIYCGAQGIPTEADHGGVRFYSVHRSKGTESKFVILIDLISGTYGFPCEVQDSSVLRMAKRNDNDNFIEEERRLCYVALTRTEKFLFIFSIIKRESPFLEEIRPRVMEIPVLSDTYWDKTILPFITMHVAGTIPSNRPVFCKKCGTLLQERTGPHGTFLSCPMYPTCDYTFDLERMQRLERLKASKSVPLCPLCGNPLVLRRGKYGSFLGCEGYPGCTFTFDLGGKMQKNVLRCPRCGRGWLHERFGRQGRFLSCSNVAGCAFTFPIK
ncbi:MAG: UvrD-helicase domain-containing protein [Promethearchaeota archaeon]